MIEMHTYKLKSESVFELTKVLIMISCPCITLYPLCRLIYENIDKGPQKNNIISKINTYSYIFHNFITANFLREIKRSRLTGFDALLIDRMVYYKFRVIL